MRLQTELPFLQLGKQISEIVNLLNQEKLKEKRWFKNKSEQISGIELLDSGILRKVNQELIIIPTLVIFNLLEPGKTEKFQDLYYLPLIISKKAGDEEILLTIDHRDYQAYVYDGVFSLEYNRALRGIFTAKGQFPLNKGIIKAETLSGLEKGEVEYTRPLTELSSNSLTLLSDGVIVKTYRKLRKGVNPDLEISLNLLKETEFYSFPRPRGYVFYKSYTGERYYLCLLEDYIKNNGDAWTFTREHLAQLLEFLNNDGYLEKIGDKSSEGEFLSGYSRDFFEEMAEIGNVLARLHLALASINKPEFRPVDPQVEGLELWYEGVVSNARFVFSRIPGFKNREIPTTLLEKIISRKEIVFKILKKIFTWRRQLGKFFRIHGDLHLEQILSTEEKYLILDFEGEPLKSLAGRRLKQSPLKDLAGMIRSYNYVAHITLADFKQKEDRVQRERVDDYRKIVRDWENKTITAFLTGYIKQIRKERPDLLPVDEVFPQVLALYKIEKALYEAVYEINNRPDWLSIPLQGINDCLEDLEGLD